MERKTVSTQSGHISYLHRKGKYPVVFLHGLGGTGNSWIRLAKFLKDDLESYFLDLPGHGRSSRDGSEYTLSSQSAAIRDFTDALGLEKFSLAGNSYGGWIAMKYTANIRQPDRLILVDSAGANHTVGEQSGSVSGKFLDKVMSMSAFNDSRIIESILKNNARPEEKMTDHEFSKITCRTAIIWGAQDSLIPVEYANMIHEKIPGSSLHIMENCGHIPQIEKPEELAGIINDFIQ